MKGHQWESVVQAARGQWREILGTMAGLDPRQLTDKHQPCPACDGHDRYRFDDKDGEGTYYCNGCGAGSGLDLLIKVTGLPFPDAVNAVGDFLGHDPSVRVAPRAPVKPRKSYKRDQRMTDPIKAQQWIDMAKPTPITQYTANHLIAPAGMIATEKCSVIVPLIRHEKMVNALAITEKGGFHFAAGAMTYGARAVFAGEGKSVFLAVSWIDAAHVHKATGCTVLASITPENFADVAFEYEGKLPLVAAVNNDQDEIALAEWCGLLCILPDGNDLIYRARKMQRKLYNPNDLLVTK